MKPETKSYIYVAVAILLLGALFIFSGPIMQYVSDRQVARVAREKKEAVSDTIMKRYNYDRNGEKYKLTFLEFGATTCHSCKLMQGVMEEIRKDYSGKVNVVFVNVTLPENKDLVGYFGIVTIPAQVLLGRDAKEYYRHAGFISAEDLSRQFKKEGT